jgi:hypothetical protein
MVTLQVKRDILKGDGISVNVEGMNGACYVLAILFGLLDLALKVLREVGWRWKAVSARF